MTGSLCDARRHGRGCSVFAATGGPPCDCGFAPQWIASNNGDVVFIRSDLALHVPEARNQAHLHGFNVSGFAADLVELLPLPEYLMGIDMDWSVVREGMPDAVRFWRFRRVPQNPLPITEEAAQ